MTQQNRLEHLAIASLNEDDCPDAERLAAYLLHTLTGNEQLRVAAHVRQCPLCQDDIATCYPPPPRPRRIIARLIPVTFAQSRRSAAYLENRRHYVAADVTVELAIAPPDGENWRVTGQVLRNGVGMAKRQVVVRAGRRQYTQTTDEQGFFTFTALRAGRYTLSVTDGSVEVRIQGIDLGVELT